MASFHVSCTVPIRCYRGSSHAADREIRVLTLHGSLSLPDQDESIVCGSLQQVSLTFDPLYFALSYVWGDASQKFPIIVDGKVFDVTTNLHEALKQLLQRGRGLPILIDAICINQQDDLEKNSQVQEMGYIYRNTISTGLARCRG